MILPYRRHNSASTRLASVSLKAAKFLVASLSALGVSIVIAGVYEAPHSEPAPPPPLPPTSAPPQSEKVESKIPKEDLTILTKLHTKCFSDFASKPGFGSKRIVYMAGMIEIILGKTTYQVPRPDLIALDGTPVVYKSPGFNRTVKMAALTKRESRSKLQTRTVTKAEQSAVEELRSGQDLVLRPGMVPTGALVFGREADGFRVVGALRANVDCAKCHNCAEGTLLGAFSYTLVPKDKASLSKKHYSREVLN